MKPKVEVETISEREHVLKVDGEIIGVSKTPYDARLLAGAGTATMGNFRSLETEELSA